MKLIEQLKKELKENANREQAKNLKRFFKTGKGEYGEGDIFLGVKVPVQRKISKKYSDLNLSDLQKLLDSKIHEYRFISLVILIEKYKKVVNSTYNFSWKDNKKNWLPGSQQNSNSADGQREIFDFYIKNSKNINNWDLVDVSAPHIVGQYLLKKLLNHKPLVQRENEKNNKNKSILVFCRIPECNILYKLAKSGNLWEKRIAIISTFAFIRAGEFEDTLKISEILLNDKHDLIHKAVGWALREVGNRNREVEEKFLKKHYKQMSRTTLRYAIEKFPEGLRQRYLKNNL